MEIILYLIAVLTGLGALYAVLDPATWRRIARAEAQDLAERRKTASRPRITHVALDDDVPLHGVESDGAGGWRRF